MSLRAVRLSAMLLFLGLGMALSQTRTPLEFWREAIKRPLSQPNASELFVMNYLDAVLPGSKPAYLEGSVAYVVGTPTAARRIRLSMDGSENAEAELFLDGRDWKLRSEPRKGTIVRFRGVVKGFTQTPFLLMFYPERVEGLDVETTEPNRPF